MAKIHPPNEDRKGTYRTMFIFSLIPDGRGTSAHCTLCQDAAGSYSAVDHRFRCVVEHPSDGASPLASHPPLTELDACADLIGAHFTIAHRDLDYRSAALVAVMEHEPGVFTIRVHSERLWYYFGEFTSTDAAGFSGRCDYCDVRIDCDNIEALMSAFAEAGHHDHLGGPMAWVEWRI